MRHICSLAFLVLSLVTCTHGGTSAQPSPGSNPGPEFESHTKETTKMAHRDALVAHLDKVSPGIEFRIEPVVLEIPGWALFTGAQEDVRDGLPFFWVVRDDGRVVVENRKAELASMFRSLALLENPDAQPAETLGMLATWLLGKGATVLKGAQHAQFAPLYDDGLLTLPTKKLNGGTYRLTFWSVMFERGPIFQKWHITVAKDYAVKVDIETPNLIRK